MRQYSDLHEYQKFDVDHVIKNPAAGLFLRPGLGKTVITLTAVNELIYDRWAVSKVLVIAPKKVAEATWTAEAAAWGHLSNLRCIKVLGSAAKRIRAINTPADIYITNRENTKWLVDYYQHGWPFDMVVLDESTSFKNSDSKRFKAITLIRARCKRVVLLTGTPSSNGLMDLWAQIYCLDEGARLGDTIGKYRTRYFHRETHRGNYSSYEAKEDAQKAIFDKISDLCISMRSEDYLELPECVERDVPVVLDDAARKAYDLFEEEKLLQLDESTITAASAAVLMGKLLQYCNGAIYDDDHAVVPVHDCKLEAFEELLEAINGEPCLVFYAFKHDMERIVERLKKTKLRVRVYTDDREKDDWNAGKIDVLLAHPASCAYGLNLQAGGRHVVWYGLNWSFELNDQGRCRLHRQGSEFDIVYVHHLVIQDSVDENVMESVRGKGTVHNSVMDALKARMKKIKGEMG